MRNQILILAAGKGARMGTDRPKVLVELKQRPLILHLLEQIEKINQLAKPVIVVGHQYRQVQDILGDGFIYAYQHQQLGTGHAVMAAEGQIVGNNILVLYGDMPFIQAESLKKLMRLHHDQSSKVSMFTAEVNDFSQYPSMNFFGRIIRDVYKNIIKITEYKDATPAERKIREVNPGIYMFNSTWLYDNIHKLQNQNSQSEFYLTDMVEVAIAGGQTVQSLPINPKEVIGINTLEELQAAEKLL
jgi:bifunctional UDP-N-acetylglucosamine pyrophosphorylase/glucosamine-1-phosphate N-acetyltransferase